jgi:hypothetical protein
MVKISRQFIRSGLSASSVRMRHRHCCGKEIARAAGVFYDAVATHMYGSAIYHRILRTVWRVLAWWWT